MQVGVTRAYRPRGRDLTGVLAALGFGAGIAVGFVCASLFGAGGPRRIGRLVRSARTTAPRPHHAGLLTDVRAALAADPELAALAIELRPVGGGAVALHGWVPSRPLRARAYRLAVAAAPQTRIQNRLLVHGEDDSPVALVVDDAPRSA